MIVAQCRDERAELDLAHRQLHGPARIGRQEVPGNDGGQPDDRHRDAAAIHDGEWRKRRGGSSSMAVRGQDGYGNAQRSRATRSRPYANSQCTVIASKPRARIGAIMPSSPCSDRRHRPVKGVPVVERHHGVTDVMSNVPEQRGDASNASAGLDAFSRPKSKISECGDR